MKEIWGISEQNFHLLFERHNAVMLLIEPDSGAIVAANESAARFYGYSRSELCALNITDINKLPPDEIAAERQHAKVEDRNYFIFPHRLASGEIRTVEVHSSPVDVQGQTFLFSIIHDITDRKKADEELKHYHENLEVLVDKRTTELKKANEFLKQEIAERIIAEEALRVKTEELDRYFTSSLDLLCIADTDGYFRRLNPEWEKTLGYPMAELEGNKFLDLVHPDDLEATLTAISKLDKQKEVLGFQNRYRCKDGSYRWIEWRSYPQGRLIYAVARDITERKQIEEDREKLIIELQESISKIRMLSGLLPICSSCKKIRNDQGYWEQIEIYIHEHSEADFSHGICPECAQRLYPEFYKKK